MNKLLIVSSIILFSLSGFSCNKTNKQQTVIEYTEVPELDEIEFIETPTLNKNIETIEIDREVTDEIRNYLKYDSFGYNTASGKKVVEYYIIDNPLFSNMKIIDFDYGVGDFPPLSNILGSDRYHLMEGQDMFLQEILLPDGLKHYFHRYRRDHFTGPMGSGLIYEKDSNGKIISARSVSYDEWDNGIIANDIKYNDDGSVTVFLNDNPIRYYNIPEQELINMYLTLFTEAIKNRFEAIDEEFIARRTKYELRIINNIIYAKHNYAFQSAEWQTFIKKYFDSNYQGIYTNEEVTEKLSDFEKSIIEYNKLYLNK